MTIILSEENIMLAYRNIKKNTGSHTPGVDGKTIKDLSKWQEDSLITYIRTRLKHYIPQPVRRVEIPKANGKNKTAGYSDHHGQIDTAMRPPSNGANL